MIESTRCALIYSVKIEKKRDVDNSELGEHNEYTEEKIKSILIDPPYNSHIDYIAYQDAFDGSYNNFMLSRIKLAYELLSKESLSEQDNLFHDYQ